jgi:hypothetical protein
MPDGPCPECGSGDVYVGQGDDSQGLRDQHLVQIRAGGALHDVDTYVCLICGHVRLFVAGRSRPGLAAIVTHNEHWRRAAGHPK